MTRTATGKFSFIATFSLFLGLLSVLKRSRFMIPAFLAVSLIAVPPSVANAKPDCPCWDQEPSTTSLLDLETIWRNAQIADKGDPVFICTEFPQNRNINVVTLITVQGFGQGDRFDARAIHSVSSCQLGAFLNGSSTGPGVVPNVFGGPLATCRKDVKNLCSDLGF